MPGASAYGSRNAAVREPTAPSALRSPARPASGDAEALDDRHGPAPRPRPAGPGTARPRAAARPRSVRAASATSARRSTSGAMCGAEASCTHPIPAAARRPQRRPLRVLAGPEGDSPSRVAARAAWCASRSTRPSSVQPAWPRGARRRGEGARDDRRVRRPPAPGRPRHRRRPGRAPRGSAGGPRPGRARPSRAPSTGRPPPRRAAPLDRAEDLAPRERAERRSTPPSASPVSVTCTCASTNAGVTSAPSSSTTSSACAA